ncbi:MAG: T9SS type A sorting domain-containing protein, partial [Bacteroidales bacterium]
EPYHAAMYATNMLIALGEVQYEEPVIMPDYLKSAGASGSQPGVDKTRKPQMLKVKPNPAKDFMIVEYELETGGNILIEITDISGKPVHSMQAINTRDEVTVDTRHWKPGAHIVTLKLNGKPVESVKFTKTQ